jgi:hypothetical protein
MRLFAGFGAPWCLAGGHAIELAVGHSFREHADIDVLIAHRDHQLLADVLPGWEIHAADPPGTLRLTEAGEVLRDDIHDLWCRPAAREPWRVQVMLNDHDPEIRWAGDIPYLAPEPQLRRKARHPRAKDEADLVAALPVLTDEERRRLYDSLPDDHPWRPLIRG